MKAQLRPLRFQGYKNIYDAEGPAKYEQEKHEEYAEYINIRTASLSGESPVRAATCVPQSSLTFS